MKILNMQSNILQVLNLLATKMPLDFSSGIFNWKSALVSNFGDGVLQAYGKTLAAFCNGVAIDVNLNVAEIVRLDTEYLKKLFKLYFDNTHEIKFIQCTLTVGYLAYNCSVGFYYRETLNNDVIILPTGADWVLHKANSKECIELCNRYRCRDDCFVNNKSFILRRCDSCNRPFIVEYNDLKNTSKCMQLNMCNCNRCQTI